MMKDTDITVLTTIASIGFALALLASISALWPYAPTKEGLANFAFALAIIFVTVLGNFIVLGADQLTKKKTENKLLRKISSCLAVGIFFTGMVTAAILFTEGLNTWFNEAPTMPPALIMFLRLVIIIPFFWLCLVWLLTAFSKKST